MSEPYESSSYSGWDFDREQSDFRNVWDNRFSGDDWIVDFESVRERIRNEKLEREQRPDERVLYPYLQNTSSACTALATGRALAAGLDRWQRQGRELRYFRPFEAWHYMIYHAMIAHDYSYGGCSIAGMMKAIADYGVLPYEAVADQPISDAQMVNLNWNNRRNFESVFDTYSNRAANYQIKAAQLLRYTDTELCLQAGYPVIFGTSEKAVLQKNGTYRVSGRTAHAMCWIGWKPDAFGLCNSWGDGYGWEPINEAKKHFTGRQFSQYVLLDIERSENVQKTFV